MIGAVKTVGGFMPRGKGPHGPKKFRKRKYK